MTTMIHDVCYEPKFGIITATKALIGPLVHVICFRLCLAVMLTYRGNVTRSVSSEDVLIGGVCQRATIEDLPYVYIFLTYCFTLT